MASFLICEAFFLFYSSVIPISLLANGIIYIFTWNTKFKKCRDIYVRRVKMSKYLMVFLFGVFLIYISVCSYKFIRYRKVEKTILRFMTSCMILFTFTIVFYSNIFFTKDEINVRHSGLSVKDESKYF
jgi:hypothetical protein